MAWAFHMESVLARDVRAGDQIVDPASNLRTVAAVRRSHRADDRFDQWVTWTLDDGVEVEVHDGDLFDRVA